jgi:hypothetical protein
MPPKRVTYSVTEVTITSGRRATIRFSLDGKEVSIPVSAEIKAYFDEQFSRPNPTHHQKKRYSTVMNLLRAAYLAGKSDVGR